jgi:hypothetical protein
MGNVLLRLSSTIHRYATLKLLILSWILAMGLVVYVHKSQETVLAMAKFPLIAGNRLKLLESRVAGWNLGDVNELFVSLGDTALEAYSSLCINPATIALPLVMGGALMFALSLLWPSHIPSQSPNHSTKQPTRSSCVMYCNLIPIVTLLAGLCELYYIWILLKYWPAQNILDQFTLMGSIMTIVKWTSFALSMACLLGGLLKFTSYRLFQGKAKVQ